MNLSNPVTVLERTEALSINRTVDDLSEPFLLKYNLNPVIFPCLEPTGGSCQDAKILVEVIAVTVNPLGAFEGTRIKKQTNKKNMTIFFMYP